MQRHPSLRSLSSEHHTGLVLARRARKAASQDTSAQAAAWEAIREIFRTELEPHFQREEQGLLPVLRVAGEVELVDRTLREHRSMHLLILENSPNNLALFAESLTAHIRFEENELFDTAQRVLGSKVLEDLERVLDGRRQAAGSRMNWNPSLDMTADDDHTTTYASPPCFMHEVDPAYMSTSDAADPRQRTDVKRWRKAERARLIEDRLALAIDTRRQHDARIAEGLEGAIGCVEGLIVSAYWPFRGEPDLRPFLTGVEACGGRCALPVVIAQSKPLVFRAWSPGDPLARGVWNIPIPKEEASVVVPDVVIAPVIGFDPDCYRLGYGGGFYDRTLAALPKCPRVFGVGYTLAGIPTIYPQWHDIPMGAVVTEDGLVAPASNARSAPA